MTLCLSGLQGHEFIDVEPIGSFRASRAVSIQTTNQRAALNDVTTTSHDDETDDDDDDDGGARSAGYCCRATCCAVRLNVCCDDTDKQACPPLTITACQLVSRVCIPDRKINVPSRPIGLCLIT